MNEKNIHVITVMGLLMACIVLWIGCEDSSGEPPQIPGIPADFSVSPGNGQVTLTWNASAEADGYTVEYWPSDAPANTSTEDTGQTTIIIESLTNGISYTFKVLAYNDAGQSNFSEEESAMPTEYVQVTDRGSFWAARHVNGTQYEIYVRVVFNDDDEGRIAAIFYSPVITHVTAQTYLTRWTTVESGRPGTFNDYLNAMTGMTAAAVAAFQRPTNGNASNGNHGIAGLELADAVSGATETGRNLVSSVQRASAGYLDGNAVISTWRP